MRRLWEGWAVALAGVFLWGCTATPMPEPPAEQLDFGKIHGPTVYPATTIVTVVGDPGSGPPGHTLRLTNLDESQAPSDVVIAADGSFEVSVSGGMEDELRFHLRDRQIRDEPVDAIWGDAGLEASARIDCVELTPPLQLGYGTVELGGDPVTQAVEVRNGCSEALQITDVRFRSGGPFTLEPTAPIPPVDIAPDETQSWSVIFTPGQLGDAEQILFLEIDVAADSARFPITLYGYGT